jgi:hypothetical protein
VLRIEQRVNAGWIAQQKIGGMSKVCAFERSLFKCRPPGQMAAHVRASSKSWFQPIVAEYLHTVSVRLMHANA